MEPKEPSLQGRILLAFALSFLILFISSRLFVGPPPEPGPAPAAEPARPPVTAPAAPAETSPPPPPAITSAGATPPAEPRQGAAPRQGTTEEQITVESDLYRAVFSTRGAAVKSWTLSRFEDAQGNPLELVNPASAAEYGDPLSIWVSDETLRRAVNSALFVPSATGTLRAPVTLTFEYSDGRITARKEFVFTADGYVVNATTELSSEGTPIPPALAWLGGFGDFHDAAARGSLIQVFYRDPMEVVRLTPGNVERRGFLQMVQGWVGLLPPGADVKEISILGQFPFAGIEDHFFCACFLPQSGSPPATGNNAGSGPQGGPLRVTAFEQEITMPEQTRRMPTLGVAVSGGDAPTNRLRLYVGPKDPAVLAEVDPLLPSLVDYGWFSFIAQPLFLAMHWTHDNIVPNYGWVIILVTVVINFALFPLKLKSMRSAIKMQRIQPLMKAIQDKYKHLKMNDPRRQEMSKETMELYKKHGVNPFGSCLPMVLQIPFLYGFYKVLILSIEMRHAPWILWVQDLSAPEQLPIKTLPLLLCGTQFLLQRMSPMPSPDPTQQKMMMYMPLMFLFMFWGLSSGLVLYWLTGNIVGIAQQWYINRTEMQHMIEEKKAAAIRKKQTAVKK
jgi:YidC/Oxa1 family membrane protein insertase